MSLGSVNVGKTEEAKRLGELVSLGMDYMGVAVTIIDCNGTLLYYNPHAVKILDRKPEYIGSDVRSHHKKSASNQQLDLMLQAFKRGRREPFRYEAAPYGEAILVILSPIVKDGEFVGCVQSAMLKESSSTCEG